MNDSGYYATEWALLGKVDALEYIALFERSTSGLIEEGQPWASFVAKHNTMERQGLELTRLASHTHDGVRRFAGIWASGRGPLEFHRADVNAFVANSFTPSIGFEVNPIVTIDIPDAILNWKPNPGPNPKPGDPFDPEELTGWEDYDFPGVPHYITLTQIPNTCQTLFRWD